MTFKKGNAPETIVYLCVYLIRISKNFTFTIYSVLHEFDHTFVFIYIYILCSIQAKCV